MDKLWTALGAAAIAAGVYYGVPPEYTEQFLKAFVEALF